jgi:hypothetical protein
MTPRNSLVYDVSMVVLHRKKASLDEVSDALPQATRQQVSRALQNAGSRGLIRCQRHGLFSFWTGLEGEGPSACTPKPRTKPVPRAFRSVFDLEGVEVPKSVGARHYPLGGWNDE